MKHSSLIVIAFICAVAFLFLKPFQDPSTSASLSHSGIFSVGAMSEVKDYVETFIEEDIAPSDILVAFDIDMTLTQPPHPEASYSALIKYRSAYEDIFKGCGGDVKDMALMLAVSDLPQILIEKETPSFIKELQSCGAKTMALTASVAGKVGTLERFEVMRYETLKRLDISFEKTFEKEELVLKDLPMTYGCHPIMYRGILCSNGGHKNALGKGSVMVAFLKAMNFDPKVLIFVDDRMKHLEDVAQRLKQAYPAIRFVGIEYHGAMGGKTAVTEEQFKAFWKGLAERAKNFIASRADEPVANKSSKL